MLTRDKVMTTIPAQPGWFVCYPLANDKNEIDSFSPTPVIAWVIIAEAQREEPLGIHKCIAEIFPATVDGVEDSPSLILLRPDEKYECPWNWGDATLEEALKHANRKER